MLEYLINYAKDNIWCSPEQDYQSIVAPHRLSGRFGALDYQVVMWDKVYLPTLDERYHVFQIGHIHPKLLGMLTISDKWQRLTDLVNDSDLTAEIYFDDGVQIPRVECWLRYGRQRNLILAVKDHVRIPKIKNEAPYMRVYTNAYYNSDRYDGVSKSTTTQGRVVSTPDEILSFQRKFHDALQLPGAALAFVNGRFVNDLSPINVRNGDYVEFTHDHSIYRTVDFKVSDLESFESDLDGKRKFLLSYPEFDNDTIDFEDDIDVYLYKPGEQGRYLGVYYHNNQKDAIRMLTHKDYSIPVSYVQGYANDNGWGDINDLVVRMYVRRSGYKRQLVQEANRIFELYRLSHDKVKQAMLGIDSTVPNWRAEHLENSPYVKIMRAISEDLDPIMVQRAFGYNAMSRLLGDTPTKVQYEENWPYIDVPPGLYVDSTAYEYDEDGLLLGFYHHTNGVKYRCNNKAAKTVELLGGLGDTSLDVVFHTTETEIDPTYDYRTYVCTLLGQQPAWDWVDISNTNIVSVMDNTMSINVDPKVDYTAVVSNKKFLAYEMQLAPVNGVMEFSVNVDEEHFGVDEKMVATIPPRRVDVWMNKHPLIEGLDYHIRWPEIVICNKQYHDESKELQDITIRATGFCNEDLTLDKQREFGFVEHGYLSADRKYDVRDDKVLSCIVGGKLVHRSELEFAEDNLGVSIPGIPNGTPYSVRENIVPMRGEMTDDTYVLRDRSMVTDDIISDYMTVKYPEPEIPEVSPIPQRYRLYSPFVARLINNLLEGHIDNEPLKEHYSNSDMVDMVKEYEDLLEFDPTYLGYNEDYVTVHPHRYDNAIQLDVYQNNFIRRIIQYYFDDKIDTSRFIEVTLPRD